MVVRTLNLDQKRLGFYDGVIRIVMTCLSYNNDEHDTICLDEVNLKDKNHMCILAIADVWSRAYERTPYINCNFLQYLYLKYIKKFKGLKRIKSISYFEPFSIKVPILIEDIYKYFSSDLFNFEVNKNLFSDIYNTYYDRRKKNG